MSATSTTPTTASGACLNTLHFVRGWLEKLLATMTDEQMLHQPVEGGNHGLWIMGHLAWCDDMFLSELAEVDATAPEEWKTIFGDGSQPTSDPSAYPPAAEVRRALAENRRKLLAWIGGKSEAELNEPLPEEWKDFAPTYSALIGAMAAHEAAHLGQLTVVRKSLGMKPALM